MVNPPVFCVDALTSEIIDDLRDASATYCGPQFAYTCAFEKLFTIPDRRDLITGAIDGREPMTIVTERLREWLLSPWHSTRTLTPGRMPAIAAAMTEIRPIISGFAADQKLEDANHDDLSAMTFAFRVLDRCDGVGPTIASKLLAPLRPALFPMWDNPIADAYGFALNSAGYRQYLTITQAIARKARSLWCGPMPLERHLKPESRVWTAPLAKVLDEWNWIRITQKIKWR